ncbi:MAG TPA: ABC transporter permease [Pyrinomonadaceae bacterium]|nr:ABC transporter permease [Pyrinomonadaceae bacterium]
MSQDQITIIEPKRFLSSLDLGDLWRHRELLYFMIWRDVKIRYKQASFGIAWAVLQPVLTTAIFTVIFSSVARFDTVDVPYPLFALSGVMIWLFVHTSVSMASNSFVSNTNLVTKIYFPRLILPLAATVAALSDLLFSVLILGLMMVYFAVAPSSQILLAPVALLMTLVLAASLGTLFSALNVRFRDVKFALPFLLQVWMIASPIFYPSSLLPEKWRLVYAINPMVGILDLFRSAVFGTSIDWQLIGISSISIVVITVLSLAVFRWMEDDFADIV